MKIAEAAASLPLAQQNLVRRAVEKLLAVEAETNEPRLEGEALKNELFDAMLRVWRMLAENQPIVMVVDDMHWSDQASIELLLHLFQLVEEVPLLFLCAMRPHRKSPGWKIKQTAETDYPHRWSEILLHPLSIEESNGLVDSLLSNATLPNKVRQLLHDKAEGNPFFVEEVIRTMMEQGVVHYDDKLDNWKVDNSVEELEIPDNLHALLIARIDRLEEEAKSTLQLASVIGRSFYYRILESITEASEKLDKHLSNLEKTDLIREAARLPELEYIFRHELTREAAYRSILRRRRLKFHLKVAEAIEELFPEHLDEEAHRLAYHLIQAKEYERALKYLIIAGDAAANLYATSEAITHYENALSILESASASNDQLLHVYTRLGRTYEMRGRYDEAISTYQALEEKGKNLANKAILLKGLIAQTTVFATVTDKHDINIGSSLAERALTIAREINDPKSETKALWNLMTLVDSGGENVHKAVEFGEASISIARKHDLTEELAFSLNDIARFYLAAGHYSNARKSLLEAKSLWRELNNLPMLADNLTTGAIGYLFEGKFDQALFDAEEAKLISQKIQNPWGQAYSHNILGKTYLALGEFGNGINALERTLPMAEQAGFIFPRVVNRVELAIAHGMLGDAETSLRYGHKAIAEAKRLDFYQSYAYAGLAYVYLLLGELSNAREELAKISKIPDYSPGDPSAFAFTSLVESEVCLREKNFDAAMVKIDETIESNQRIGLMYYQPALLCLKGDCLQSIGQTEKAIELLSEAQIIAEKMLSRYHLMQILSTRMDLDIDRGDLSLAEAHRKEAHKLMEFIAENSGSPELKISFLNIPISRKIQSPIKDDIVD